MSLPWPVSVALAVALTVVPGYLWARVLLPGRDVLVRLALAIPLGLGVTTLLWALLLSVPGVELSPWLVWVVALGWGLLVFARRPPTSAR